jgi:hypothetical protein
VFALESFGRSVATPALALVAVGDAVYGALAAPTLLVYAAVDAGVVAYLVVADDACGVGETTRGSRLAGVARVVEEVDPHEEDDRAGTVPSTPICGPAATRPACSARSSSRTAARSPSG